MQHHTGKYNDLNSTVFTAAGLSHWLLCIDVINVYNVYKKFFVNAFIILSTFISIKITWTKRSKIMTGSQAIVHCVRIGHWLNSLGHGASDGKQLPHDGAPPTEQTSRLEDDWAYRQCRPTRSLTVSRLALATVSTVTEATGQQPL